MGNTLKPFAEIAAKLQPAALDAVIILHAALYDRSSSTRIRAARAILDLRISLEIGDLENRLRALEQRK